MWHYIINHGQHLALWCQDKLHTTSKEDLQQIFKHGITVTDDPFEKAGYYYLWQALAFRGIVQKSGGLCDYIIQPNGDAYYKRTIVRRLTFFKEMYDFYNPNLTVGCGDFEETLAKHPDLFAYCDPPYPVVKGNCRFYNDEKTADFPHERLQRVLSNRKPPWLLSNNDHEITRDLYPQSEFNWHYQSWNQSNSVDNVTTNEVLITPKD